jgi:hypothetical protein
MIDALSEQIISLTDAARILPARRGGKRVHVSCVYRWTKSGCRGVILESIQIGGTRCTTREALARFFDRLTHSQGDDPPLRTLAKRQKASEAAGEELGRMGA